MWGVYGLLTNGLEDDLVSCGRVWFDKDEAIKWMDYSGDWFAGLCTLYAEDNGPDWWLDDVFVHSAGTQAEILGESNATV